MKIFLFFSLTVKSSNWGSLYMLSTGISSENKLTQNNMLPDSENCAGLLSLCQHGKVHAGPIQFLPVIKVDSQRFLIIHHLKSHSQTVNEI